jgi:hypothetical protein
LITICVTNCTFVFNGWLDDSLCVIGDVIDWSGLPWSLDRNPHNTMSFVLSSLIEFVCKNDEAVNPMRNHQIT